MNRMFIPIIGSVFFFGCTDFGRVHDRMTLAESQMQSSPDSALTTIMSVDRRHLRSSKDEARYALIYSQALDKNYIDVANDSLTRIASEYYGKYGPCTKADCGEVLPWSRSAQQRRIHKSDARISRCGTGHRNDRR